MDIKEEECGAGQWENLRKSEFSLDKVVGLPFLFADTRTEKQQGHFREGRPWELEMRRATWVQEISFNSSTKSLSPFTQEIVDCICIKVLWVGKNLIYSVRNINGLFWHCNSLVPDKSKGIWSSNLKTCVNSRRIEQKKHWIPLQGSRGWNLCDA